MIAERSLDTHQSGLRTRPAEPLTIRGSIWSFATHMVIGAVAFCAVIGLFCTFLFVSLLDDLLRVTTPRRLWDYAKRHGLTWPQLVENVRKQLTHLAEWEQHERNLQTVYRIQDLISAFLNEFSWKEE